MLELYAAPGSGNCFKPFLAMRQLRMPMTLRMVDVLKGESKSAGFLAINPVGTVPHLRFPGGAGLSESNAMLWYIADDSSLMPSGPFACAKSLQWCFFEQSRLEPFIAPARFLTTIAPERRVGRECDIAHWQSRARDGLAILDAYLSDHEFIAGETYSIGDIGVFGYVHVAPEGGIDLAGFPAVRTWIDRVKATPDFVSMDDMTSALLHAKALEEGRQDARVA